MIGRGECLVSAILTDAYKPLKLHLRYIAIFVYRSIRRLSVCVCVCVYVCVYSDEYGSAVCGLLYVKSLKVRSSYVDIHGLLISPPLSDTTIFK